MKHIERTPLSSISRMEVYENTRKLPLSDIVAERQPDIALTAVFYNPNTWEPVCPVKAAGEVLFADPVYNYRAIAWNDGPDAVTVLVPPGGACEYQNYVANNLAVINGEAYPYMTTGGDSGGRRGRVAAGITKDGEWLTYGCTDGADAITPVDLRAELVELGCEIGIIMDGGRKVNVYIRDAGVMMEGKDPSQTLVLIWLNKEDKDLSTVRKYSLKKSGNLKLSDNFRVREFACNDGSDEVLIADELVDVLQEIRNHFGEAVNITSGYRTSSYNTKVGGAPRSQHVQGTAADIILSGEVDPREVAQFAEFLMPDHGGIGVYQTFTHVDVRAVRSRWDSRSGKEVVVSGWPGYSHKPEADVAIDWITGAGIMLGDGGDLMLEQPLTRKQLAVMLRRYHKAFHNRDMV